MQAATQTRYGTAKLPEEAVTGNNRTQSRQRMPCPRCIGGNMFRDHDEFICIQCGYNYYPDEIKKVTATIK